VTPLRTLGVLAPYPITTSLFDYLLVRLTSLSGYFHVSGNKQDGRCKTWDSYGFSYPIYFFCEVFLPLLHFLPLIFFLPPLIQPPPFSIHLSRWFFRAAPRGLPARKRGSEIGLLFPFPFSFFSTLPSDVSASFLPLFLI